MWPADAGEGFSKDAPRAGGHCFTEHLEMTLDRSLRIGGAMARQRSVLSRAERIAKLAEEGKFDPEADSPMGLPKVLVKHSKAGQKAKKEEKPEEGAEVAAAPKAGAAKAGAPKAAAAGADKAAPKGKGKG